MNLLGLNHDGSATLSIFLVAAWFYMQRRAAPLIEDEISSAAPSEWPEVVAVVPARDEAALIARSIGSLLAQNYPGQFRIIFVDDSSSDGTKAIARALLPPSASPPPSPKKEAGPSSHFVRGSPTAEEALPPGPIPIVLSAPPRPHGWTGKLAAVAHGIAHAGEPKYLWLTDADIEHTPDSLRHLVAKAEAEGLTLNSRMALLRTETFAERAIVPAFVYFFGLLYPFRSVNNPRSGIAAAAGGCMLVRREALLSAGGIGVIRGALIDDVAMGTLMKNAGPIRLALSRSSRSLRPYGWRELWAMIVRSAYAQLGFSPLLLLGTVVGVLALFWLPFLAAIDWRMPYAPCVLALFYMLVSIVPMLRFYRQSPFWALALPLVALFYAAATLASAVQHWRGRGGMWKGRAQAMRPA